MPPKTRSSKIIKDPDKDSEEIVWIDSEEMSSEEVIDIAAQMESQQPEVQEVHDPALGVNPETMREVENILDKPITNPEELQEGIKEFAKQSSSDKEAQIVEGISNTLKIATAETKKEEADVKASEVNDNVILQKLIELIQEMSLLKETVNNKLNLVTKELISYKESVKNELISHKESVKNEFIFQKQAQEKFNEEVKEEFTNRNNLNYEKSFPNMDVMKAAMPYKDKQTVIHLLQQYFIAYKSPLSVQKDIYMQEKLDNYNSHHIKLNVRPEEIATDDPKVPFKLFEIQKNFVRSGVPYNYWPSYFLNNYASQDTTFPNEEFDPTWDDILYIFCETFDFNGYDMDQEKFIMDYDFKDANTKRNLINFSHSRISNSPYKTYASLINKGVFKALTGDQRIYHTFGKFESWPEFRRWVLANVPAHLTKDSEENENDSTQDITLNAAYTNKNKTYNKNKGSYYNFFPSRHLHSSSLIRSSPLPFLLFLLVISPH